jgi:hypothetical protein
MSNEKVRICKEVVVERLRKAAENSQVRINFNAAEK